MLRRYVAVVTLGALACLVGCAEEDATPGPEQPPVYSDLVDSAGLVWAIGTMGGLKAIDMADTVLRAVDLGRMIYDFLAVSGPHIWVAGGTGSTPMQRVTLLSDTTDTLETTSNAVTAAIGRPTGLDAAGGRVWAIGRGTKALFGIDTAANTVDLQVVFTGVPDSGGCVALAPFGPAMYVLSTNPFVVHAVDMASGTLSWQLALDSVADSTGKASMGVAGDEVYVYVASRRELVAVSVSGRSVVRRVTVSGVSRSDEMMTASSAGVFVTQRASTMHSLLAVSAQTGDTLGHYDLADRTESLSAVQAFGQRLLLVLIDSSTGQNSVLELWPSDMSLLHRVNHVYVTRVAVQR